MLTFLDNRLVIDTVSPFDATEIDVSYKQMAYNIGAYSSPQKDLKISKISKLRAISDETHATTVSVNNMSYDLSMTVIFE